MESGSVQESDDDALIGAYLVRVRRAARRLPQGRRECVIARTGDLIREALDASTIEAPDSHRSDNHDVQGILARLGEPRDIVQAVDGHVPGDEAHWPDYLAVLLLVTGGFAFLPGWVAGAVLLWASPRWRLSERLVGTLIWPGGLTGFWYLLSAPNLLYPFRVGWYAYGPARASFTRPIDPLMIYPFDGLRWLTFVTLGVGQALVAIWLIRRARRPELTVPSDFVTGPSDETSRN